MQPMVTEQPYKRFIPFTSHDLVKLVLTSGDWSDSDQKKLSCTADLLSDLLHFEFHRDLEDLKNAYVKLNPDRDTLTILPDQSSPEDSQRLFAQRLEKILIAANYDKISYGEIKAALAKESLVKLQLHTDFDDFETILFYGRGEQLRKTHIKTLFGLRNIPVRFTRYDRVAIYFQVKPHEHFEGRKIPAGLVPGATLLKLFRNVPKADLEMLFPNTEVRMRLFDKLLIGVPAAVSGGVVLTTKLGGTLLLLGALLSFWLGFRSQPVIIDQAALLALGAGLAALGGYLWKQFSNFKNRKLQFMKTLTDNLYFRNLDNNAGVFFRLVDEAEEEEFKEAFLAYIFLLKSNQPLSRDKLDECIEQWFEEKCSAVVDFEIKDALRKLHRLGLVTEEKELLTAVPLPNAQKLLTQRWNERKVSKDQSLRNSRG